LFTDKGLYFMKIFFALPFLLSSSLWAEEKDLDVNQKEAFEIYLKTFDKFTSKKDEANKDVANEKSYQDNKDVQKIVDDIKGQNVEDWKDHDLQKIYQRYLAKIEGEKRTLKQKNDLEALEKTPEPKKEEKKKDDDHLKKEQARVKAAQDLQEKKEKDLKTWQDKVREKRKTLEDLQKQVDEQRKKIETLRTNEKLQASEDLQKKLKEVQDQYRKNLHDLNSASIQFEQANMQKAQSQRSFDDAVAEEEALSILQIDPGENTLLKDALTKAKAASDSDLEERIKEGWAKTEGVNESNLYEKVTQSLKKDIKVAGDAESIYFTLEYYIRRYKKSLDNTKTRSETLSKDAQKNLDDVSKALDEVGARIKTTGEKLETLKP